MTQRRRKRNQNTSPKTTQSTENFFLFFKKIGNIITSENTPIILGLLLGFITLYSFLSYVSYFFTGSADKSLYDNISLKEAFSHRNVQNWGHFLGAYLSENLIDNLFGIPSLLILVFSGGVSLKLMKVRDTSITELFLKSTFGLIWLSLTFSFLTSLIPSLQPSFFSLGGKIGDYITIDIFGTLLGNIGIFLLLSFLLISYLIITWDGFLPFVRGLFSKNKKENIENEDTENRDDNNDEKKTEAVAIGTEIVPEDWVTVPITETEETEKVETKPTIQPTPPKEPTEKKPEDIGFEVAQPTKEETVTNNTNNALQELGPYDPRKDLSNFEFPHLDLLKSYSTDSDFQVNMDEQKQNKEKIITTLRNFGIEITSIKATVGPTITLYEIVPKSGIRISKIRNLESDIMLSLAATGIRIIAPIPGKGTIGIEVPNSDPQIVSMRSVISSKKFMQSKFQLPIAFGKTITNEVFMVDLAKMPHLLVAGATGQGKSVGLNALITSLLYKKHPAELKFVLIDPKKVEFNIYEVIEKHFLAKLPDGEDAIITDTSKVVQTLNSLTAEMDDRYDLLKKAHVRNLREYNEKFINRQLNPEKGHKYLPYIVVIVDEFGDLIMTAGKEVEMPIARIAQLARAVGIHMVLATQRPSVNIITGVIKANFPARVAFRVSSMIDSRTILDGPGANQLVGRGDMLFSQGSDLVRVQCAFVDTPEVEDITKFIGNQRSFPTAFYLPEPTIAEGEGLNPNDVDMTKRDPLFEEVARMIVTSQQGSTSMIQRKFSIGYNRAGRIMDQLEVATIVGPADGSKPRQVLVQTEYELEKMLGEL